MYDKPFLYSLLCLALLSHLSLQFPLGCWCPVQIPLYHMPYCLLFKSHSLIMSSTTFRLLRPLTSTLFFAPLLFSLLSSPLFPLITSLLSSSPLLCPHFSSPFSLLSLSFLSPFSSPLSSPRPSYFRRGMSVLHLTALHSSLQHTAQGGRSKFSAVKCASC
jgi:hypothetical protein